MKLNNYSRTVFTLPHKLAAHVQNTYRPNLATADQPVACLVAQANAQLKFFFHRTQKEIDNFTPKQWAKEVAQVVWVRKEQAKYNQQ